MKEKVEKFKEELWRQHTLEIEWWEREILRQQDLEWLLSPPERVLRRIIIKHDTKKPCPWLAKIELKQINKKKKSKKREDSHNVSVEIPVKSGPDIYKEQNPEPIYPAEFMRTMY